MRTYQGTSEVRNLSIAELNHTLGRQLLTLVGHHPRADLLVVLRIRDTEHLHLPDAGMAEEEALHLARMDVKDTARLRVDQLVPGESPEDTVTFHQLFVATALDEI